MIVRAAVKIFDNKQNKEVILPVHRHCDAFQILHDLGYKISDFKTLDQGFLDEKDNFLNRLEAKKVAAACNQILPDEGKYSELFSEDLW
jgi:hypothetical protein